MSFAALRWTITALTVLLLAVHILDLCYLRKTRHALDRVFRAGQEGRDERLAYAERLAHIIRGKGAGKRIKAFESAQHKLTEHQPLNRRERYWLRHAVYQREKWPALLGYLFWPLFVLCLFLWQILPFPFLDGRSYP